MLHKVITHYPYDYERVMVLYKALLKYWDEDLVLKYNIYAWMHFPWIDVGNTDKLYILMVDYAYIELRLNALLLLTLKSTLHYQGIEP